MTPVLPTLFKSFRPIAAPPRTTDPKLKRRETFAAGIREQLQLLENPKLTRTIKVKGEERQMHIRPWWYESGGETVLAPKFGVRNLELSPGCTALKVSKSDLKKVLTALGEAAAAGELDDALARAQPAPKQQKKPAAPAKAS